MTDMRITDEEGLYKALYRLRKLDEEQAHDDAQRQKELDETNAWYVPATKTRQDEREAVESRIKDFYLTQYEANPHYRYKSRNGSVSKRKTVEWTHDDQQLIDKVPADYIKTTKKLQWGDFKKTLTPLDDGRVVNEDGEIVPGVTATSVINVTIKPTKGDD